MSLWYVVIYLVKIEDSQVSIPYINGKFLKQYLLSRAESMYLKQKKNGNKWNIIGNIISWHTEDMVEDLKADYIQF